MSGFCCCDPVFGGGTPEGDGSIANVGGGAELYVVGSASPWEIRTLVAGSGITINTVGDTLTITATATVVTLASVGTGASLVADGTGPALENKSLLAGTGISITGATQEVTIENTDPGSAVTLTSAGGTHTLVADGAGPALGIKGLTSGAGISFSSSAGFVTITNANPASAVTLTSAGGTETLVNDGTGPALATKGLTAGAGITLTGGATDVTVTNSSPASSVTLTSAGGTETLVNDGTGPALATKGLTAGAGITLSSSGTAVTIAASGSLPTTYYESSIVQGSTNNTTYVTVWTSAATAAVAGQTWVWWCSCLIIHVVGLSTVNTRFRWQYETAAGTWATFEDNINVSEQEIVVTGEKGSPRTRIYNLAVVFTGMKIRLQTSMSAAVASGGTVEAPQIMGLRTV